MIFETAHRYGDELLLWDSWGATECPDDDLVDAISGLLIRADNGDRAAEHDLAGWYARDERLHPGARIIQLSPFGRSPRPVDLRPPAGEADSGTA